MKTQLTILSAVLSLISFPAWAFADHQYKPVVASQKQPFDVYTDGKNTYIEAIKGLTVRGASKQGDSFVLPGVPDTFLVQINGKQVMIARMAANVEQRVSAMNYVDPATSQDQSRDVRQESDVPMRLAMTAEERSQLQAEMRAQVSSEVLAQLQAQLQEVKVAASMGTSPMQQEKLAVEQPAIAAAAPGPATILTAEPKVADEGKSDALVPPAIVAAVTQDVPAYSLKDTPKEEAKPAEIPAAVAATQTPPTAPQAITTIKRGSLIHESLKQRAEADGWTFLWYPTISWEAIGDIDLTRYKNADEAVDDIITGLREEGKPIQLRISDGNKIMEVLSTEVKND